MWRTLPDEQQLAFKSAQPGLPKAAQSDALQQYEPQALDLDKTLSNFALVTFTPHRVDHLIMAPPQVVADSRRKPQQYESLAQPFKRDRRFLHEWTDGAWTTVEVNP